MVRGEAINKSANNNCTFILICSSKAGSGDVRTVAGGEVWNRDGQYNMFVWLPFPS